MSRVAFLVGALALATLALLARTSGVAAHATLIQADPPANAYLQRSPPEIALAFAEPLDLGSSTIRLLDATGRPLSTGPVELSGSGLTLRLRLQGQLAPGIYNVLWTNISRVDGHALRGSYPFTVLEADGSLPAGTNQVAGFGGDADPPAPEDGVAVRALALLGILAMIGPVVIFAVARPLGAQRRGLLRLAAIGFAVAALATALHGVVLDRTYADDGFWDIVTGARSGHAWLVRWGALAVAGVGLLLAARTARFRTGVWALAAGSAVFLLGFTATSHAAAGAGANWAMAADALHTWSATVWVGAVIGLAFALRLGGREARYPQFAARFALVASLAVFLAMSTGFINALAEIDAPSRLVETNYGRVLLAKVALLGPLLGVALYNARWGRRRATSGARQDGAPRAFVATIAIEGLLGLGVVVLAAVLTQTTAAKSVQRDLDAAPFAKDFEADGLTISLAIDPNRTGLNTFTVRVLPASEVERVRLTFRYRDDENVGPSTLTLVPAASGDFLGQGPYLPLEGNWQVEVEVRRPDKDDVRGFFEVRPAGAPILTARSFDPWANPAPGLTWNEFAGVVALLAGLGFALFKGQIPAKTRSLGWSANGATLAGFGVGMLLLFGVHGHDPDGVPINPIAADRDSIAKGREIFLQNCAACHGLKGVPPQGLKLEPYPLDLTVHAPLHSDGALFSFIDNGIGGTAMRAWGSGANSLSDDEIWHVVNFLRTLGSVSAADR